MQPFDFAWHYLRKAVEDQQMGYDEGTKWNRTMHPAIQGMAERAGATGRTPSLHDFSAVGGDSSAFIQNLPGHPAEFRNNPKEEGEQFRRPYNSPQAGQQVGTPQEIEDKQTSHLSSLFGGGPQKHAGVELLPESYKERNARTWQEHRAQESAPFVEPAERSGYGGDGKKYKDSHAAYNSSYEPTNASPTALEDIEQSQHPLGDYATSDDLPEAVYRREQERKWLETDAKRDARYRELEAMDSNQ